MSAEGGGGHGGNWIVTYADMITLLMAGFIVIVTFGSRETDKMAPRSDSVIGTQGGTGTAGGLRKGPDKDAVVVRRPPMAGNGFSKGSEMAPVYSDVPIEVTKAVEAYLDSAPIGNLSDGYDVSIPLGLAFDGEELSTAGKKRLEELSRQLRNLPYEILIQVGNQRDVGKSIRAYQHLFQVCDITPLRLGVGLKPSAEANGMLVLAFRHPPAAR
jgi:hypothetical protein